MALSEIGRSMGQDVLTLELEHVQAFLDQASPGEIYDARLVDYKVPSGKVEHVNNLNEYVSREVEQEIEAEIRERFPVPVEKRLLGLVNLKLQLNNLKRTSASIATNLFR